MTSGQVREGARQRYTRRLILSAVLLAIVVVWGWTFVLVKDAIGAYGVVPFLAVRFSIGAICLAAVCGPRLQPSALGCGLGIGAVLALGFLLQTWGLSWSTATNTGVITGLFGVFAPLANRLFFGVRTGLVQWSAVAVSLGGLALLSGAGPAGLVAGDAVTVGAAAAFGLHIAMLDRYAKSHDATTLTFAQVAMAALLFLLAWLGGGEVSGPPRQVWLALLVTGVVATALAFFVQTYVQQRLSAFETAVILLTEPLWAALFGHLMHGDRLTALQWLGASLMVAALFLAELYPLVRRRGDAVQPS